jgi:glycosyltransferase involved in cell wall biosynthesis
LIIDIVIPAYNEEQSVPLVIADIPRHLVREIIVVDNHSSDRTAAVAGAAGAVVVSELRKGYGSACLAGLAYIAGKQVKPAVVVFMDADHSDHPEQLSVVIAPILNNTADMVIGSRAKGRREPGSMLIQQRFGNWLATKLIWLFYGHRYSDLGPFRAITWEALGKIGMHDTDFGWTVEMQIKALKQNLRVIEVPVDYRKRVGVSKIAGTVRGTVMAGYKIIYTIFKYR